MDLWIIAAPLGIQNLLGIPRVSEPSNQKAPPHFTTKTHLWIMKVIRLTFIHILTWSFSSNCVSCWVKLVIHESTLWLEAMSSKKCLAWGQMAGRWGVGWLKKNRNSTGPRHVYYTVVLGLGWRTCTQLSFPKRCSKDRLLENMMFAPFFRTVWEDGSGSTSWFHLKWTYQY